jgi:hypothetical protein
MKAYPMLRCFPRGWWLPALFVAALFAAGCGGGGRPSTADETKDGAPLTAPTGPDLRLVKPDFNLTAAELGAAYETSSAREKYKGKVIELSGDVRFIRRDESGRVLLWLTVPNRSPNRSFVDWLRCVVHDPTPWKEVTPGQAVKIKGKVPDPDYDGSIALLDCAIVEATGPRAPTLSADQVAREYRADPVGFTKKYDSNGLILSGEIIRTDLKEHEPSSAVIKTPAGEPRVVCHFGNLPSNEVRQLKRGQKIRVLCESGANDTRDEANLEVYLLMERAD